VKNNDSNKGAIIQVEEYNVISNFTQLVTAPICDDDILHVQGRPGKSRGPVQKYKQALNLGAK